MSIFDESLYIPWHRTSLQGNTPPQWNIEDAKNVITSRYFDKLAIQSKIDPTNEELVKKLEQMLDEMNTDGALGGAFQAGLNILGLNEQNNFGITTGAGLQSFANKMTDNNIQIPDQAAAMLQELNSRLDNIVTIMNMIQEPLIAEKIIQIKDTSQPISTNGFKLGNGTIVNSKGLELTRLANILQSVISSINEAGQADDGDLYNSMIQKASGCLSAIGGLCFELVSAYAIEIGTKALDEEFEKINKEIPTIKTGKGLSYEITIDSGTGQQKVGINKVMKKGDITAYLSNNDVNFEIPISVKSSLRKNNYFSQKSGISQVLSHELSYVSAIEKTLDHFNIDNSILNPYWQFLGSMVNRKQKGRETFQSLDNGPDYTISWKNMIVCAKYIAFFDYFVGNMTQGYAGAIIFNNRSYSLYGLMKNLADKGIGSNTGFAAGNDVEWFKRVLPDSKRKSIYEEYKNERNGGEKRTKETIAEIFNYLANKKINISLNFARALA